MIRLLLMRDKPLNELHSYWAVQLNDTHPYVHLSRKPEACLARKGCKVLLQPTPEAYECSTNHMQRRLGFFTLPVEKNTFHQSCLEWHIARCVSWILFHAVNGNET
jgi:hypothetical protein